MSVGEFSFCGSLELMNSLAAPERTSIIVAQTMTGGVVAGGSCAGGGSSSGGSCLGGGVGSAGGKGGSSIFGSSGAGGIGIFIGVASFVLGSMGGPLPQAIDSPPGGDIST